MNKLTTSETPTYPASPTGEVTSRLNQTNIRLNDLSELVGILEYRLSQVLSAETPSDDKEKANELSETDLGYQILNSNNLLQNIIRRIDGIVKRVQL